MWGFGIAAAALSQTELEMAKLRETEKIRSELFHFDSTVTKQSSATLDW